MDAQTIATYIAQFGFPMVMCLIMAWYVKKQNDEADARVDKMWQQHIDSVTEITKTNADEVKKLTEVISNNTMALEKLVERVGKSE